MKKTKIDEKNLEKIKDFKFNLIILLLFSIALSFVIEISYFFAKEIFELDSIFFIYILWAFVLIVFFISFYLLLKNIRYFFK